jgi:hypothetical protein
MGNKIKPRHRSRNNPDPRLFQDEGLISKNESRKDKRAKRDRNGSEWKRERESM